MRLPLALSCLSLCVALATPARVHAEPPAAPTVPAASAELDLSGTLDRNRVLRAAIARNPGLRASHRRAAAMRMMGEADSRMPPPEAEVSVWQVPLSRPYSVPDASMIMVGVKQPIPAPGSLSARAQVREREADVEDAMVAERVRELMRDVDHALVDYMQATAMHHIHIEHKTAADRVLAVARARYQAAGAITDVTQADVESSRIEADIAQEEAKIAAAKAKLNGLLVRPTQAPLGEPVMAEPVTLGETLREMQTRARSTRPELRTAEARRAARLAEVRVAEREASWPMLSVGALYFAPTNGMPSHGYGVTVSSSLPWLSSRASTEARAGRESAGAIHDDLSDIGAKIDAEVATDAAMVQASTRRYQVLRDRTLPAGKRAWEAAASGYESGRADILMLLMARKSIAEIEVDLVEARAMIEHALVDLDWAVGKPVRRVPIGQQP
ncbi:MAG: TolC family protein [Deltaproteobacteria bacterium]|nr:TolC family protein [Deltaproteobacteria bacterium]